MATYLTPDKTTTVNGVKVKEYLLTKHNPNKISMPTQNLPTKPLGITIHNTDWIKVNSATTPAEQYTRATVNGNARTVRVHYYVDNTCAWQNLPLTLSGWHAADGSGNGNRKTIAIECIMDGTNAAYSKKSRENAARLIAYLLDKYGLTINDLYTHTYWLHKCKYNGYGVTGTHDYMCTHSHPYKTCPQYIIPDWENFKKQVQSYMKANKTTTTTTYPATPFVFKVTAAKVGIHVNPDTTSKATGVITTKGCYTITEVKGNYGKLKSGLGWIYLKGNGKVIS